MKRVLVIVGGILLVVSLIFFFRFSQFYSKVYTPKKNAPSLSPEKTDFNILFLGYGGEGHEGSYLTDTLILLHLNLKTNRLLLISLPRDIWVRIPTRSGDPFHAKINTLYEMELFPKTFPDVKSTRLLSQTVTGITGLPVDYYLGAEFSGFVKIIDTLGGVDVTVKKSFTDPEYPIDGKEDDLCGREEDFKKIEPFLSGSTDATPDARPTLFKEKPELEEYLKNATESPYLAFPCRYEPLSFQAGTRHMDGKTALKFARSRHSPQDGGDFARARRQQQVIEALKDKLFSLETAPKITKLLDSIDEDIRTDIPPALFGKIALEVKDAGNYKISNLVLSDNDYLDYGRSGDGQSILMPKAGADNWDEVNMWIKETINPQPTLRPTLKPVKK